MFTVQHLYNGRTVAYFTYTTRELPCVNMVDMFTAQMVGVEDEVAAGQVAVQEPWRLCTVMGCRVEYYSVFLR